MSEVRVKVIIEIDGPIRGNGDKPSELCWEHTERTHDNPFLYADTVSKVVNQAADKVLIGLALYKDSKR